jgi:hypothetical protein
MGPIEQGVMASLLACGVKEPHSALEHLAIELARTLDKGVEDKTFASLSRELRLTLKEVEQQSGGPGEDKVRGLMDKNR